MLYILGAIFIALLQSFYRLYPFYSVFFHDTGNSGFRIRNYPDVEEISTILDLPITTIKTRLHRARNKLALLVQQKP